MRQYSFACANDSNISPNSRISSIRSHTSSTIVSLGVSIRPGALWTVLQTSIMSLQRGAEGLSVCRSEPRQAVHDSRDFQKTHADASGALICLDQQSQIGLSCRSCCCLTLSYQGEQTKCPVRSLQKPIREIGCKDTMHAHFSFCIRPIGRQHR